MSTHNLQLTPGNTLCCPTIAVFDSGFGGLTVLRALMQQVPAARYIYLGDTARLPYGAKSPLTVARYAVESARFLAAQGAEILVIACNTATALALPEISAAVPIPVVGVIEPVVQAARSEIPAFDGAAGASPTILVLATSATVQSLAYTRAIAGLGLGAYEKACPLLVPLVEEGWTDHRVTREVARIYLTEALAACAPAAVVLGCTHYPLIRPLLAQSLRDLGSSAIIIDSAHATASAVKKLCTAQRIEAAAPAEATFYATDSTEKFQRLGSAFLGQPLSPVHLIDLGG